MAHRTALSANATNCARSRAVWAALLAGCIAIAPGCGIFGAVSKVGEAIEHEKQVEVLAKYRGLENKSVAVVASADRTVLYEYPTVVPQVVANVAAGVKNHVSGTKVLPPMESLGWCFRTPNWDTLPRGQLAQDLGVDRVVVVEIYEFRLNPPGNRWIWEGMAAANVSIMERDSLDPDSPSEEYSVTVRFPEVKELSRESAREADVQLGLTAKFTQTLNKLFYDHMEAKYPNSK